MGKTFSIVNLGCFRNRYDSETVAERLAGKNDTQLLPEEISKENKCDTLIINTCGFIDPAKAESAEAIEEAIALKKEKKVGEVYVFGCLVQRFEPQLKKHFAEVDRWWGVEEFSKKYKKRLTQRGPVDFLKICEGCLNCCSYCAIPIIKGPLKSRPALEVIKEVKGLDRAGVKELNIIGQDITSWGKDLKTKKNLAGLLKAILKVTKNIKWFRLIYTHPRHLSDDLINLAAGEGRICNYIDLPIQHINKKILKLMNRKTTPGQIVSLIKKIREKIPDCAIRTSVIVGFPGEGEAEFNQLLAFIKEIKFEKLGVFVYSREKGTEAFKFSGQVHHMVKKKRMRRIMEAQQKIVSQNLKKFVGKKMDVLVLEKNGDFYLGRTEYDAPEVDGVVFIKRKNLRIGRFYKLKIIDSLEYDLVAK